MKRFFIVLSSLILSISSLLTFDLCYKNNIISEIGSSMETIDSQTEKTNSDGNRSRHLRIVSNSSYGETENDGSANIFDLINNLECKFKLQEEKVRELTVELNNISNYCTKINSSKAATYILAMLSISIIVLSIFYFNFAISKNEVFVEQQLKSYKDEILLIANNLIVDKLKSYKDEILLIVNNLIVDKLKSHKDEILLIVNNSIIAKLEDFKNSSSFTTNNLTQSEFPNRHPVLQTSLFGNCTLPILLALLIIFIGYKFFPNISSIINNEIANDVSHVVLPNNDKENENSDVVEALGNNDEEDVISLTNVIDWRNVDPLCDNNVEEIIEPIFTERTIEQTCNIINKNYFIVRILVFGILIVCVYHVYDSYFKPKPSSWW